MLATKQTKTFLLTPCCISCLVERQGVVKTTRVQFQMMNIYLRLQLYLKTHLGCHFQETGLVEKRE